MTLKTLIAAIVAATSCAAALATEPITPIRPAQEINLAQAELGKKLYFDPGLSKSGFISCNSCHNLSMGGTDNLKTSIGDRWQQGPINAPTVLNSSLNVAKFWDGRATDLKAQAGGPIAFIRLEAGKARVTLDGVEHSLEDDWAVVIPAGTKHNVVNVGDEPVRLYSVYSPPEHKDGTVHATKADDKEEHFDGVTTE